MLSSLLAGATIVSLVACGGTDDVADPPPTSPTATSTSTSPSPSGTPGASPTPAADKPRSVQKYGTLTLTLDLPAKPGTARAALRSYADFERRTHKMVATNVDDPGLKEIAVPAPVKAIRDNLAGQIARKERSGGQVSVTARVRRASSNLVLLTGCYNQSKSLLVRANGTAYRGPGATKYPKLKLTVIITNMGGAWMLTEYRYTDDPCTPTT